MINYYNQGVLVSPSPSSGTGMKEVENITSIDFDYSFSIDSAPIYGQNIYKIEIGADNSSRLNLSYYIYDFENEKNLGLNTEYNFGIFSDYITKQGNDRNYYVCVGPYDRDIIGVPTGDLNVLAFANGLISSYSMSAEVGAYPSASVSVDCLNTQSYPSGSILENPSVYAQSGSLFQLKQFSGSRQGKILIKPGDVRISLGHGTGVMYSLPSSCVQSVNFEASLERQNITYLAEGYPRERRVQFPIPFSLNITLTPQDISVSKLKDFICANKGQYVNIAFFSNGCISSGSLLCGYSLRNMSTVSQNVSTALSENQQINISWEGQIGGFNDQENGIFLFKADDYEGVFSTVVDDYFGTEENDYLSP